MSKRLVVSIVAVLAAGIFSPLLRAQDEKWNRIPPPRSAYAGKKSTGPVPRRDISGIWDSGQVLGTSGATEHPALFPGGGGSDGPARDCVESVVRKLPRDLDRWARTAQGSRSALQRVLGGQMGGRLHVRGGNHRDESQDLDRSRRPST